MKTFQGKVIATKMTKAAVVLVERKFRHPLYGKIVKKKKKIHAVNEIGAKKGETVNIVETRPISKTISFKISEIVDREIPEEEIKKKTPRPTKKERTARKAKKEKTK